MNAWGCATTMTNQPSTRTTPKSSASEPAVEAVADCASFCVQRGRASGSGRPAAADLSSLSSVSSLRAIPAMMTGTSDDPTSAWQTDAGEWRFVGQIFQGGLPLYSATSLRFTLSGCNSQYAEEERGGLLCALAALGSSAGRRIV